MWQHPAMVLGIIALNFGKVWLKIEIWAKEM